MARKFRFRLESVLKLRHWEAEKVQVALGQSVKTRMEVEKQIEQRNQYRAELSRQQSSGQVSVRDIESRWYHVRAVEQEIRNLESRRGELLEIESARRAELSEALKKTEVLKKLKEKEYRLFLETLDQEERRELDEVAQRTHTGSGWN